MNDWKKLRQLAEGATPGPWRAVNLQTHLGKDNEHIAAWIVEDERDRVVDLICPPRPVNAAFIAAANPTTILALLDENDSLRAEVERLRMQHGVACSAAETMTGAFERSQQQLSAALAAKDEACEIALQWAAHLRDLHGDPRDRTRIVELRSIGKDGGNG